MFRRASERVGDALSLVSGPAVRYLLRPLSVMGKLRPGPLESGRRLVLIQIDGVSRKRLEWAFREGLMPFLKRRLEREQLGLSSSFSGCPASTPAFQAGLLHGLAPSVPGFVWYDRARKREVRMDRGADAAAVEAELTRLRPPLLRGGTSYFSIFSGGAAVPHFCLSGLAGDYPLEDLAKGFSGWDALASALVHAVTASRTAGRAAVELAQGVWDGVAWSVSLGRWKHEPQFLFHRLVVSAFMRELAVQGLIIDMARGVPVLFCDFLGYDEFSHRRGPDAPEAVESLRSIDTALATIYRAAEAVPELAYDVYVFSDHGHVATRPFQTFTGLSLPEYLALAEGGVHVPRRVGDQEAVRLAQTRAVRELIATWPRAVRERLSEALDELEGGLVGHALGFARGDKVITAEAGDLAHVYFPGGAAPLTLEELRARHPRTLAALQTSRAVGLVAVRNGRRGAVLVGQEVLALDAPGDVARLPHPQPQLLADYLADLLSLETAGDLVVEGWRGPDRVPVAYAWEFGSHGGVAPEELETFFVHPPRCELRFSEAKRPDALYRLFHEAYRTRSGLRIAPPRAVRTA